MGQQQAMRGIIAAALALAGLGCTSAPAGKLGLPAAAGPGIPAPASAGSAGAGPGRGFPASGPWASFYGTATQMGDLDRVAASFRIISLDADPASGRFSLDQITRLKAGGRNRVIGYFNLGAVETGRDYYEAVPAGFVAAKNIPNLGPYEGYPDEIWMNPANADWRHLLLDFVAPRLVAQGIDGFYFDNLEVLEHGTDTANGPCDAGCAQGALDLVRALRMRYPGLLFVMQNATGSATRTGTSGGRPFTELLDGVAHEDTFSTSSGASLAQDQTYRPFTNPEVIAELQAWQALKLKPGGRDFWIGTEDYVNTCNNAVDARAIDAASRELGFSPYLSDRSALQTQVCFWDFSGRP